MDHRTSLVAAGRHDWLNDMALGRLQINSQDCGDRGSKATASHVAEVIRRAPRRIAAGELN